MIRFHLDDVVIYNDRPHEVVGVLPMSVSPQVVLLADTETGELVKALVDEVDIESPHIHRGASSALR